MSTKALTFAARELSIERRSDGTLVLSSPLELGSVTGASRIFFRAGRILFPIEFFLRNAMRMGNGTRSPTAKHGRRFRRSAKA